MSDKGGSESFFSRWSQRKSVSRSASRSTGRAVTGDAPPASDKAEKSVHLAESRTSRASTESGQETPDLRGVSSHAVESLANSGAVADATPAPLPALDTLTPEADFSPFMQKGVDGALRNQAMKTLFSDPHFNVMDGLDIYIDDYSQSAPIPDDLMRQMYQAKSLFLFEAEKPPEPETIAPTTADAIPVEAKGEMPATPTNTLSVTDSKNGLTSE